MGLKRTLAWLNVFAFPATMVAGLVFWPKLPVGNWIGVVLVFWLLTFAASIVELTSFDANGNFK